MTFERRSFTASPPWIAYERPREWGLSYAIQGGLAVNDLLSKVADSSEPPTGGTEIPIE